MNRRLKKIIKRFIPENIRRYLRKVYNNFLLIIINASQSMPFNLKRFLYYLYYSNEEYLLFLHIIKYCEEDGSEELLNYSKYLKKNGLSVWLSDFISNYSSDDIPVYCTDSGWHYVLHNGKKLFGKRKWKEKELRDYYNSLLIEQDSCSPHRYLNEERMPQNGDNAIVADIGAAEGIFSLDIIDKVKKVYLFECDEEWIEPLYKTFEPYKEKIEIVKRYVGSETTDNTISLDDFFQNTKVDYIKADIEGAERELLKGARKTLQTKIKQILICAYHLQDDEEIIVKNLSLSGFQVTINPGKMLIYYDEGIRPPYFRPGVIYGFK